MKENGTLDKHEEEVMAEAMEIMGRWLDRNKDEAPRSIGFWGIEEARYQLAQNMGYMRGE